MLSPAHEDLLPTTPIFHRKPLKNCVAFVNTRRIFAIDKRSKQASELLLFAAAADIQGYTTQ